MSSESWGMVVSLISFVVVYHLNSRKIAASQKNATFRECEGFLWRFLQRYLFASMAGIISAGISGYFTGVGFLEGAIIGFILCMGCIATIVLFGRQ